jgi:hypothetical protein
MVGRPVCGGGVGIIRSGRRSRRRSPSEAGVMASLSIDLCRRALLARVVGGGGVRLRWRRPDKTRVVWPRPLPGGALGRPPWALAAVSATVPANGGGDGRG